MDSKLEDSTERKLPPNAGKGRVAGVPNKATKAFRDTVNALLEGNADNVAKWLKLVAEGDGVKLDPDPYKALDMLAKLAEYATPKLARTELTGKDGGPVVVSATPLDEKL